MSTPDQYCYFLVGSDHWRVHRDEAPVEFWDGDEWRQSILPNREMFLNDALGSGATVREILDLEEVPRVHS